MNSVDDYDRIRAEARAEQDAYEKNVNHPSHYTSGRFEVIDIIEDQLGLTGLRDFCLGNAIKYICRAGKKNPEKHLEDLQKAVWYINHYIQEAKEA